MNWLTGRNIIKEIKLGGGVGDVYLALKSSVLYKTDQDKPIKYTYAYFTPSPDKLSKISIQITPAIYN